MSSDGQRLCGQVCEPSGRHPLFNLSSYGIRFLVLLFGEEHSGSGGLLNRSPQHGGRLLFQTPLRLQRLVTGPGGISGDPSPLGSPPHRFVRFSDQHPTPHFLQLSSRSRGPGSGCLSLGQERGQPVRFSASLHDSPEHFFRRGVIRLL